MKVKVAYEIMWNFQSLMLEDIRMAKELELKYPTDFALRTIFRTSAAYIEGTIYQLRLVCLAAAEDVPHLFSSNEMMSLKEKTVYLNSRGVIEEKDSFSKILPSILFTFSSFAKLHSIEFKPNTGDHRWNSLRDFFSIRNALMHPKSQHEFKITKDKNKMGIDAVTWFDENFKALLRACEKADEISGRG
jgi:hypothetical protein